MCGRNGSFSLPRLARPEFPSESYFFLKRSLCASRRLTSCRLASPFCEAHKSPSFWQFFAFDVEINSVSLFTLSAMDDSDGAVNVTSEELSRLTPGDNRELQQFIQNENQKSQIQRCKLANALVPILCFASKCELERNAC